MFTGLIELIGVVTEVHELLALNSGRRLRIEVSPTWRDLALGESIAINGACMTVVNVIQNSQGNWFNMESMLFDVEISSESLRLTTLRQLAIGSKVNLERALLPTTRLGGHFVTGHVDGLVRLDSITPDGIGHVLWFSLTESSQAIANCILAKGSVALNGVSLTINEVDKNKFSVMIIPHTWTETTLSSLIVGDFCNIEADMLIKAINKQVSGALEQLR